MKFQFIDNYPSKANLVAFVVSKASMPKTIEPLLIDAARASRFKGKAGQLFEGFVDRNGNTVRLACVGIGENEVGSFERLEALEKAGAALAAKYLTSGEKELLLDLTSSDFNSIEISSILLGIRLRSWRHDAYRTKLKDEEKISLSIVTVLGADEKAVKVWHDASCVAEGVEFTRHLVAEPANKLFPTSFVEMCQARFEGTGAELIVLDEDQMLELGMGALLGVGQGSEQPSRILAIKWDGGTEGVPPIAFVGKGVTFDTGGISLKPPSGMWDMKWDMGGSGAVAGAMLSLAKRKAKANVVGVVGLVENMPDGKAQRPGDIVRSMSGQTIEVLNTDAEGRLVLCDALTWTQRTFKPERIIDLATLTGAMIIALGKEYGGMFANDDDLANDLVLAGKAVGDKLWRLPLGTEYDKLLNSPICDMKNIGPREGGSITAAQFLQRFIEDNTPWAHLDIAGMVWSEKAGRTWDKGATGYGARLLDTFIRMTAEN